MSTLSQARGRPRRNDIGGTSWIRCGAVLLDNESQKTRASLFFKIKRRNILETLGINCWSQARLGFPGPKPRWLSAGIARRTTFWVEPRQATKPALNPRALAGPIVLALCLGLRNKRDRRAERRDFKAGCRANCNRKKK